MRNFKYVTAMGVSFLLAIQAGGATWTASDVITGTSFEGAAEGPIDISSSIGELVAITNNNLYWGTNASISASIVSGTSITDPAKRHEAFTNSVNDRYLYIKSPLDKAVKRFAYSSQYKKEIESQQDYFLDSLVNFQGSMFESNEPLRKSFNIDSSWADIFSESSKKMAVWLLCCPNESTGTLETNIVITAAYYDANKNFFPTNYLCQIQGNANPFDNNWHRLTVRVHGNSFCSWMVVYIDGCSVVSSVPRGNSDVTALLTTDMERSLLQQGKLFFACDSGKESGMTLGGFSYAGEGLIDDLLFTTISPNFAKDIPLFTLRVTPHASVSFSVMDSKNTSITNGTSSSFVFLPYASGMKVSVTPSFDVGYYYGGIEIGTGVATNASGLFVPSDKGQYVSIIARIAESMLNGVYYNSIEDAFNETSASSPLFDWHLKTNVVASLGFSHLESSQKVILDLEGHSITGNEEAPLYADEGILVITNSTSTIGSVIPYETVACVVSSGKITISGGKVCGEIQIESGHEANLTITGGMIDISSNSNKIDVLNAAVERGLGAGHYLVPSQDSQFFVVQ